METSESSLGEEIGARQCSEEDREGEQYEEGLGLELSTIPSHTSPSNGSCNVAEKITNGNVPDADLTIPVGGIMNSSKPKVKMVLMKFSEGCVVVSSLLVIIALFTVPTVFYALSLTSSDQVIRTLNSSNSCEGVKVYSGEICAGILTSLQTCYSGVSSPPPALNIPSAVDQQQGEMTATQLLGGLALVNPSPECTEMIQPFICLHIFGLCDSSSNLHTPLRGDCLRLRDSVCINEWAMAVSFLPGILPECEELPDVTDECTVPLPTPTLMASTDQTLNAEPRVCSDGFYNDQNGTGLCRPECGEFERASSGIVILERVTVSVGIIVGIAMCILALTLQRNTLLVFPSILLVYFCGSVIFLGAINLVGFFDNTNLFCGSQDQIYAVGPGNETSFCTISGVTFYYSILQMCIWAVLHATFLFWAIYFPFSYRRLQSSGKMRHAHIISVLLALILPLLSALIPLKEGHLVGRNPTYACVGRNTDYTFYTFILPVSIIMATTLSLLMFTFWMIFKAFVIKEMIAGKKLSRVGKAEIKIMIVFIYYTLVSAMGLMSSTYAGFSNVGDTVQELFICESTGNRNCSDINLDAFRTLRLMSVVNIATLFFSPVVAIVISFNPKTCKKAIHS